MNPLIINILSEQLEQQGFHIKCTARGWWVETHAFSTDWVGTREEAVLSAIESINNPPDHYKRHYLRPLQISNVFKTDEQCWCGYQVYPYYEQYMNKSGNIVITR